MVGGKRAAGSLDRSVVRAGLAQGLYRNPRNCPLRLPGLRGHTMTGSTAMNGSATSLTSANGARPSMVRASLELFTPVPVSGSGSKPGGQIGTIPFQFNPKELTI